MADDFKIDLSTMALDPRCKVCKLTSWNVQLFLTVHEKKLVKGFSHQSVQSFLNKEIEAWNQIAPKEKQQAFVSDSAISNHFKKHIPAPIALNGNIKTALGLLPDKGAQILPPHIEKVVKGMEMSVDEANLDEFQRFHNLVQKVDQRFEQWNAQIDKTVNQSGGHLTMEDIAGFKALAELLGRLRKDSIQLRNQERVLTAALTSAMDVFSVGSLTAILKSLDHMMLDQHTFVSKQKAEEFSIKFRASLAESLIASAKVALDMVRNSLKTA